MGKHKSNLRRIVNTSSAATETYLAHRLPDKAGAIATPIGLLFLLFAFDWRLGLLSLVPVVLGIGHRFVLTVGDAHHRDRDLGRFRQRCGQRSHEPACHTA